MKHLTGRFQFRESFWGNVVLYVEWEAFSYEDESWYSYWTKATMDDVNDLNFNK